LGILILGASLAVGWVWIDYREFKQKPLTIPDGGLVYELPSGGSAASLARDLHARGVLDNVVYLRLLARLDEKARSLQAGEYRIEPGTTPAQLLELLSRGQVIQYPLTLVEGWTFPQILYALHGSDKLEHLLTDLPSDRIMARLGRPGLHPEGRFLPDTYHFPRGASDLQVLQRALEAMDRLLEAEWAARDTGLPLESAEDALILASIVEKETGLASERPLIAGVFVRRLRKGMLLQSDPTVIYGLGESFDGDLRRADLQRDTPYNTYVHQGLPPTPIAMPGPDAIHAVLHPQAGNSLYFVATGDGGHHFSASLAEHNRAVRKYQLKR
jgi:UPF0755 protein